MASRIVWRGDEVRRAVEEAAKLAIDQTTSASVIDAKDNHPGWNNVSGNADGSIRTIAQAVRKGRLIVGEWGSKGVNYMMPLEVLHGSALRTSADRNYPSLFGRIRTNLRSMVGTRG